MPSAFDSTKYLSPVNEMQGERGGVKSNMKKLDFSIANLLAIPLALSLWATSADAASVLDQQNAAHDITTGASGLGQSFRAGLSGQLAAISLGVDPSFYVSEALQAQVSVSTISTTGAADLISMGVLPTIFGANEISYDLTSLGVSLTAGQTYSFYVDARGFASSRPDISGAIYAYVSSDNYSYGNLTLDGNAYLVNDLTFATYVGNESASSVPESDSWMMMIGGLGMVGAALRRSRRRSVRFV